MLVALAGLPGLPRFLYEAKSYAEQLFTDTKIEQLHPGAAKAAIVTPAAAVGVEWQSAAVDRIVRDTRGYPYFLQQYGQASGSGEVAERLGKSKVSLLGPT